MLIGVLHVLEDKRDRETGVRELIDELKETEAYLADVCDWGVLDKHPAFARWNSIRAAIARCDGKYYETKRPN